MAHKVIAEVRFNLVIDDEELELYRTDGLAALFDRLNMDASEFDEILFEDVEEFNGNN